MRREATPKHTCGATVPKLGPPHVSRERGPPEITPGGSAVAAHPTGDPTEADAPRNETRDNAGSLRGIREARQAPSRGRRASRLATRQRSGRVGVGAAPALPRAMEWLQSTA